MPPKKRQKLDPDIKIFATPTAVRFPDDLLSHLANHLSSDKPTLQNLQLVSHAAYNAVTPILYRSVTIDSIERFRLLFHVPYQTSILPDAENEEWMNKMWSFDEEEDLPTPWKRFIKAMRHVRCLSVAELPWEEMHPILAELLPVERITSEPLLPSVETLRVLPDTDEQTRRQCDLLHTIPLSEPQWMLPKTVVTRHFDEFRQFGDLRRFPGLTQAYCPLKPNYYFLPHYRPGIRYHIRMTFWIQDCAEDWIFSLEVSRLKEALREQRSISADAQDIERYLPSLWDRPSTWRFILPSGDAPQIASAERRFTFWFDKLADELMYGQTGEKERNEEDAEDIKLYKEMSIHLKSGKAFEVVPYEEQGESRRLQTT